MINKASQMKTAGFTIGALSGALAIGFGLLNKSVVGRVALKGQEAISTIGAGVAAAVSLSSLSVGIAGAVKERKITRQNQEPRSRNVSQGDGDSDSGEILGEQAYEALIGELVAEHEVREDRAVIHQVIRKELEGAGTPLTRENVIAAARRLKEQFEASAKSQESLSSSEGESSEASTSTGGAAGTPAAEPQPDVAERSPEEGDEADSAPVPGKEIPLDETYSEVTEELKRVNSIYDRLGVSAVAKRQAIRDLIFAQGKKETEENIRAAIAEMAREDKESADRAAKSEARAQAKEYLRQQGVTKLGGQLRIIQKLTQQGVALTKENLQSAAQQYRLAEATELVRRAVGSRPKTVASPIATQLVPQGSRALVASTNPKRSGRSATNQNWDSIIKPFMDSQLGIGSENPLIRFNPKELELVPIRPPVPAHGKPAPENTIVSLDSPGGILARWIDGESLEI